MSCVSRTRNIWKFVHSIGTAEHSWLSSSHETVKVIGKTCFARGK